MKHAFSLVIVLLAFVLGLSAAPQFRDAGAFLISETRPNGAIEHDENVTVRLALKNIGDQVTTNLIAILQTGDGVSDVATPSQTYGVLNPCGPSVARDFSFKCTAASNSLLLVNLALEDSGHALGTITYRFRIGPQVALASSTTSVTINPVGPAEMFPSVLSVSNAAGPLVNVSLTLSNLSHTYPDDLDILLVSPGGDRVLVMSDACGAFGLDHVTLTFSDDAQASLPDSGFPNPRVVRPSNYGTGDPFPAPAPAGPYAGVMSAFNGKEANGDWQLFIMDDNGPDGGILSGGWFLTLTTLILVDSAPRLTLLEGSPNETIRFQVRGRPGYPYAIECSQDPVQFLHLESFQMPLNGSQIFEYSLRSTNQFFRAATDP
ncbi:MAG TPA: hypothetical protein VJ063_14780 [Verrucomicrobiae bacterium]|nr:hypothetical protein [Verrucomicrobiae bacterium]